MKKAVLLIVLVLGLSNAFGGPRGEMPKEMIEKLQLSHEQVQKMQTQRQEQRAAMQENFAEIRKLHSDLDKEFVSAEPNEVRIKIIVEQIKQAQSEIADKHFEGLFALREILTPEQFKKMVILRQDFEKKHKNKPWFEKGAKSHDKLSGHEPPPPPPEGGMLF